MPIVRLDTVDSTNAAAQRIWHAGLRQQSVTVVAREQSAGRGRFGRTWLSPRDAGLYVSVLNTATGSDGTATTAYTQAGAVACASALEEAVGIRIHLKPINDLIAGDRKLGGILVEAILSAGHTVAVITGMGINTHHAARPLPKGTVPAVSMEELAGTDAAEALHTDSFLALLTHLVLDWNARLAHDGTDAITAAWRSYAMDADGKCAAAPPGFGQT